MKSKGMKNKV